MDIAQLPHLPEKTSESSETSDSESDSKDNSGNISIQVFLLPCILKGSLAGRWGVGFAF